MKTLTKWQNALLRLGACLLLAGVAAYLLLPQQAPYIYLAGAGSFVYMQALARYEGSNVVIRRLRRQQLLGAVLLLGTGVLMLLQSLQMGFLRHNEWVLCLTIAAVLELYTAFRIASEIEKE